MFHFLEQSLFKCCITQSSGKVFSANIFSFSGYFRKHFSLKSQFDPFRSIVCAVFAPSDNTAFNGQKKNESNIVYKLEGGEQNVAKVSFPSVYNVVGRNSSDCAKPGITFFYDYFIKQYQNSKNNSCSIMERVPLGENKNLHSDVDFVYRKRNLLWIAEKNRFHPKTLRPNSNRCSCSNRRPANPSPYKPRKNKHRQLLLDLQARWKKNKGRKKSGQVDKENIMKTDLKKLEKCTLSPKEKKMFLCLKRCRGRKNDKQKANLGTLEVDDDLDLNKRIKKLVDQLAAENHRKKEHLEESITSERRGSEVGYRNSKNEDELSPILNNIKQLFLFNKNKFNDRIVGNTKTDRVSSMRFRYPGPEKTENTVSSYDVLRTMRKTIRLRRNTQKSHNPNEFSKNRGSKYKNNLFGWSNPYSANFKGNANFLNPQRSRKFLFENTKKRRWMKMRMRRNREKKGLRHWPILKRAFEKFHGSDAKPACRDRCSDSNRKPVATNKTHRSCINGTGSSQEFSLKDETVNCVSDGWKDSESVFKIVNSNPRAHEKGESATENVVESMKPECHFYTMEKPLLEKQLRDEKLKLIKDIDEFMTEGPSTSSVDLQAHDLLGGVKNHINPLSHLKFRHSRDNIYRNKVGDPKKLLTERKKRHGWKSAANKNWKSAPMLCTSYIRKGQEDQIRCLIKVIQNMMGKQVPLKFDNFEQTKYKPSCGRRRDTPRDFDEEIEPNYPSSLPYRCNSPHLHSKLFQLFPRGRFPISHKIPYEPVKVEGSHDVVLESSSTPRPTASLPRTTGPALLHQPQDVITKPVPTFLPISFPNMERSGKTECSPTEQVASTEPLCLDSNAPVTHSSRPTSTVPVCSSSAKPPVTLKANVPTPTDSPCNDSTWTTTPACVTTTTCATTYKSPRETSTPSRPVPKPSTATTCVQQIRPSTVNTYVLQESESKNVNEGISAVSTCKGEECVTVINQFSEAPSEESQTQERVEQVPSEDNPINPMAVRPKQQPNPESVGGQYRAPGSRAGFKGTKMYNSDHFTRVGRSKNEESRRKLEMIQKLFGNNGREAGFRCKRFHHCKTCDSNHSTKCDSNPPKQCNSNPPKKCNSNPPKKCNSKSNSKGNKKCGLLQFFKKHYNRLIEKGRNHAKKKKSKSATHQNQGTKPSGGRECPTLKNLPECSGQQQSINIPVFSTPVYVNTDYLPIYDQQTQQIIQQSPDTPKQIKSENLLPIIGEYPLDARPFAFALNLPPEQNENYVIQFTKKPPVGYDVEPEKQFYLKRQKRSDDYYVWPENDYGDYVYDPKDAEEDSGGLGSLNEDSSDSWTPPSYDMFRELAKAVIQTENHRPDDKSQAKMPEGVSTSKPLTSTGLLALSHHPNSTTARTTVATNTTAPTTSTTEAESKDTEEPTTTATSATTTTAATTTTTTTTTPSTTTTGGKTKSKSKGGKKSYERFSKHSGSSKNLVDSRDDKERQIEEMVPGEDIHGPTTLKAAVIVRGQKKFQGKPSPKVYMKVFPDSFEKNEQGGGEALIATTARAAEAINIMKNTDQGSLRSDLRLQILAVCEGYLEVVKLIKAQNQSLAEDTDENLARYCENIISQHFNFQSEKSKKFESNELLAPTSNKKDSEKEPDTNDGPELYEDFISPYDSKAFPKEHFHEVSASDNSDELVSKRKTDRNLTSKIQTEIKMKKRRRNAHRSSRRSPKLKIRKKKDAEEDLGGKGIGKQQKQLIQLLRKRKKALLSWLLTSNDGIKPDDLQETEYFDEEDLIDPESDTAQYSGTIKPRRDEKIYRTTPKNKSNSREPFFPVYAKDYGYESGGELIEVEVLWRQVNEKTHENKIFKNLSVLALLLTSTPSPKIKAEETKLVGDDNEIDTETKWKKNNAVDDAKMEAETDFSNTSSTNILECMDNSTSYSEGVPRNLIKLLNKQRRKNQTHTYISKPDPTSIVGAPSYVNKTHRKFSHKYGVAKDIFQEYSIEFLNYAVYILPVMFTILFLLCCLCCALQILKIQKSHKKRKKKKKKVVSSEDTSVSCTSETESKKRKRDTKRKRNPGSKENYDNVHKKKSKTFWNYLKVYTKPSREMDDENDQTEKKKSFLGFLKCRREEGKPGYSSAPTGETDDEHHTCQGGRVRKHYSDQYLSKREHEKHRKEEPCEATERRELIALLEELKKIETEHIEGKKEVKSVQVQYAIPEYDNSLFQPKSQVPDFPYPYEKNVFGMPKGICPFYNKKFPFHPTVPPSSRDYDLYEEVNELTKLLPWECYPQRKDFLKHCDIKIDQTGRCDRFLKIFRDSGMNCNGPVLEKNCKTSESESRGFIFNKYRSINMDKSEELRGVSTKISGTEVRLMENVSPCKLSSNRDEDLVEDVENLKCQLNKKKYARLKDEGVLCRL